MTTCMSVKVFAWGSSMHAYTEYMCIFSTGVGTGGARGARAPLNFL